MFLVKIVANAAFIVNELIFLCYPFYIGGAMINVLTSSAVDRGFESISGQTKGYKICIFC